MTVENKTEEVKLEELIAAHSEAKRALNLAAKRAVNTEASHNVAQAAKLEAEKDLKKAAKTLRDALVPDDETGDVFEKVDDTQYTQDFWTRMFQPPTTFDNMYPQVDRFYGTYTSQPKTGVTWKS